MTKRAAFALFRTEIPYLGNIPRAAMALHRSAIMVHFQRVTLQPPTDNLYKFLAIAGLLLIFFSAVIPMEELRSLIHERKVLAAYPEAGKKITEQLKHESEAFDATRAESDRVLREIEGGSLTPSEKAARVAEYKMIISKLRDQVTTMHEMNRTSSSLLANFRGTEAELNLRTERSEESLVRDMSRFALGLAMTIFGFYRWYTKVQRYQDALLRADAVSKGLFTEDHDLPPWGRRHSSGPKPPAP